METSKLFCVYVLKTIFGNRTYVGKTNDMHRRYRQHIKLLSNGARYTSCISSNNDWIPVAQIIGFESEKQALQFEYAMKAKMTSYRNKQLSIERRTEIKSLYEESVKKGNSKPCARIPHLFQCLSLPRWTTKAIDASTIPLQIVWYGTKYRPVSTDQFLRKLPYLSEIIHDGIRGDNVTIYQSANHVYTKQQRMSITIKCPELD